MVGIGRRFKMKLWNVETLVRIGQRFNKATLKKGYLKYCKGKPSLDSAVAYSMLVIANNTDDRDRYTAFLKLLHSTKEPKERAYRSLEIRRWSPVKKALKVYPKLIRDNNNPSLEELVEQQREKSEVVKPSWATLMPDKIYTIARFLDSEPPEKIAQIQSPFGKAVQAAFSIYSGVQIAGQPTITHHLALKNFERAWADWGDGTTVDINTGLYLFGYDNLI